MATLDVKGLIRYRLQRSRCVCLAVVRLRAPCTANAGAGPEEALHNRADPATSMDEGGWWGDIWTASSSPAAAAASSIFVIVVVFTSLGLWVRRTDSQVDARARHRTVQDRRGTWTASNWFPESTRRKKSWRKNAFEQPVSELTLWRLLLPYGYSYKASCAWLC